MWFPDGKGFVCKTTFVIELVAYTVYDVIYLINDYLNKGTLRITTRNNDNSMDLLQVLGRQHDDGSSCEIYSNPYSKTWVGTPKGMPQTA